MYRHVFCDDDFLWLVSKVSRDGTYYFVTSGVVEKSEMFEFSQSVFRPKAILFKFD